MTNHIHKFERYNEDGSLCCLTCDLTYVSYLAYLNNKSEEERNQ